MSKLIVFTVKEKTKKKITRKTRTWHYHNNWCLFFYKIDSYIRDSAYISYNLIAFRITIHQQQLISCIFFMIIYFLTWRVYYNRAVRPHPGSILTHRTIDTSIALPPIYLPPILPDGCGERCGRNAVCLGGHTCVCRPTYRGNPLTVCHPGKSSVWHYITEKSNLDNEGHYLQSTTVLMCFVSTDCRPCVNKVSIWLHLISIRSIMSQNKIIEQSLSSSNHVWLQNYYLNM